MNLQGSRDLSWPKNSINSLTKLQTLSYRIKKEILLHLLSNLLHSASTQVLLNGEPGAFITHQRGLRQGDPLSPMPCILVMNVLNRVVFKAEAEGLLIPLHSTGQRLSLYADDVTLFIRSEKEDLHITKELLKIFCDASGLQTNIQKSWFIPIHCDGEIVEVVNTTLQCTTTNFPTTYLGTRPCISKIFTNYHSYLLASRHQSS